MQSIDSQSGGRDEESRQSESDMNENEILPDVAAEGKAARE